MGRHCMQSQSPESESLEGRSDILLDHAICGGAACKGRLVPWQSRFFPGNKHPLVIHPARVILQPVENLDEAKYIKPHLKATVFLRAMEFDGSPSCLKAEVEAKQAASEGRDAMILKVPEAPAPEPSGTWIGS